MALFSKKIKDDGAKRVKEAEKSVEPTKKEAVKTAPAVKVKKAGSAYRVLARPLITEKSAQLKEKNQYLFEIAPNANKIETARAVEEIYGVKPVSVNIINKRGKRVRYGRAFGARKAVKKAIVKLPKGKEIKVYEGV